MRKIRKIIFVSAQHLCNKQLFLKHCTHLIQSIITGSGEILKHVPHLIMHKGLVSMSKLWRNSKKKQNKTKGGLSCLTAGRKLWNNYACYDMTFTKLKRNWSQTAYSLKCFNCSVCWESQRYYSLIIWLVMRERWVQMQRCFFFFPPCWSGCPYCFRAPRLEPSLAINRIIFKG